MAFDSLKKAYNSINNKPVSYKLALFGYLAFLISMGLLGVYTGINAGDSLAQALNSDSELQKIICKETGAIVGGFGMPLYTHSLTRLME